MDNLCEYIYAAVLRLYEVIFIGCFRSLTSLNKIPHTFFPIRVLVLSFTLIHSISENGFLVNPR